MIRSYKDALLSTTSAQKQAMTRDAQRLLNRTHCLYDTTSYQCATLQLLLQFCDTHAVYITRDRETATLHEVLYKKLAEFRALVRSRLGVPCRCVTTTTYGGNPPPTHSYEKYASAIDKQLRRYKTLPGSLMAAYIELGKRLAGGGGNDVVKHIMSFVTTLPI